MNGAKPKKGKAQEVDWNKVENFLRKAIPGLPEGEMKVSQFSEGYSNLTYLLQIGAWEGVLRRPPFGEIPPKAHDMEREFKMLEKVHPVFPLAPEPFVYCEDPEVMDKHFFIMERKAGIVVDEDLPEKLGSPEQAGPLISKNVVSTLVQLQSIDYKEAGLAEMGKPEGFMERQVKGWIKRYHHSKTDEIEGLEELEQWLIENIPVNEETTIVHNDFKLNNMVIDEESPGLATGVLDWELSTIGDPLSDVGSTLAYWGQAEDEDIGINIISSHSGFYSRKEFVEEYAKQSGRDVSNINYYLAFGFYKLAGILQQIYYRWDTGEIEDERFHQLDKAVANLIVMANRARKGEVL
ncbi:phosphotransferase family protein [Planococcus sp. SIMBA_160]